MCCSPTYFFSNAGLILIQSYKPNFTAGTSLMPNLLHLLLRHSESKTGMEPVCKRRGPWSIPSSESEHDQFLYKICGHFTLPLQIRLAAGNFSAPMDIGSHLKDLGLPAVIRLHGSWQRLQAAQAGF